jgi:hypothetical protein
MSRPKIMKYRQRSPDKTAYRSSLPLEPALFGLLILAPAQPAVNQVCQTRHTHISQHTRPLAMEYSGMTGKWSSKPKEQAAARVRENQRRHRARTKAYIAELERRLSEMQARLNNTLMQNSRLISELEKLQGGSPKPCAVNDTAEVTADRNLIRLAVISSQASSPSPSSTSPKKGGRLSSLLPSFKSTDKSLYTLYPSGQETYQAAQPSPAVLTRSEVGTVSSAMKLSEHGRSYTYAQSCLPNTTCSPLSVTIATSFSQGAEDLAVIQVDCSHLPPPKLGESTIPCKTAYRIIKEQNYNGMDSSTIGEILAPGFRSATVQEDGCRVESNRVFSILDIINP